MAHGRQVAFEIFSVFTDLSFPNHVSARFNDKLQDKIKLDADLAGKFIEQAHGGAFRAR